MEATSKLRAAFLDRQSWLPYFDQLNSLFCESKLRAIHDAKTMAVIKECLNLIEFHKIDRSELLGIIIRAFPKAKNLALSSLIDLTSERNFERSLSRYQKKEILDTHDGLVENSAQLSLGF